MSQQIRYSALTARGVAIDGFAPGSGVGPSLYNLTANSTLLGKAIENGAVGTRYQRSVWCLTLQMAANPNQNSVMELYFLLSTDLGANFGYGAGNVNPSPSSLVGTFQIQPITGTQILHLWNVPLPPCLFKPLLWNKTNQATASTAGICSLAYFCYGDELYTY